MITWWPPPGTLWLATAPLSPRPHPSLIVEVPLQIASLQQCITSLQAGAMYTAESEVAALKQRPPPPSLLLST